MAPAIFPSPQRSPWSGELGLLPCTVSFNEKNVQYRCMPGIRTCFVCVDRLRTANWARAFLADSGELNDPSLHCNPCSFLKA